MLRFKKGKNEMGTLCTSLDAFPLAGLRRSSSLVSFCKKWTFQCEACGPEKKNFLKGHFKSRAFFASQKPPTKNTYDTHVMSSMFSVYDHSMDGLPDFK